MSFQQYRPPSYSMLPPVIKNLLIINVLFFAGTLTLQNSVDMYGLFGLHFPTAPAFKIWQPITYMFMHGGFEHILFNMFALWMFGTVLENYWGPKRFLLYYLVTGIGAAVIHYIVLYFMSVHPMMVPLDALIANPSLELFNSFYADHSLLVSQYATQAGTIDQFNQVLNTLQVRPNDTIALNELGYYMAEFKTFYLNEGTVVVGASGAIFGLLLAFGMLFPNSLIYLYFFFPLKAKYFVILYGAAELFLGIRGNVNDNVAHFAHLGGMLFGFILIKYWQKTMRNRMY